MIETHRDTVVRYYDSQAEDYFEKFANEVEQKPYDKVFLDRFAQLFPKESHILDIGCSASAQQANYLRKESPCPPPWAQNSVFWVGSCSSVA